MAILVASSPASAQVITGLPPYGSFSGRPDIVNNANLNVLIQIPIFSRAGRGLSLYYALAYDSSTWSPRSATGASAWTPVSNFGWGTISQPEAGAATYAWSQGQCHDLQGNLYNYDIYANWAFLDTLNAPHPIATSVKVSDQTVVAPNCHGSFPPYTAAGNAVNDGSGYILTVNAAPGATAYDTSGDTIQVAVSAQSASVTDPNGNQLSYNGSSFSDTLGSALTVSTGNPTTFTYTNPNNNPSSFTMKYTQQTVQTNFGCSGITEFGPLAGNLVSEIDLPDGTKYTFTYEATPGNSANVTGRIASVTLPTGGQISYSYENSGDTIPNDGISCSDGSATYLARTTPDGAWTYTRSSGPPASTTIQDPQGNQTVIDFQGIYETERKVNQGTSTLLETVDTCYNGASIPCTGTAVTLPISNRTVQVTLPGLSASKTYTTYNSYGLATEVDEYDWGGSTPLRKTLTTYDYNTSCGVTNAYVVNRACSVQVENGAGTLEAQTTLAYDANGDLLTETHTNTGGSPSSISRSFTYNSNGTISTATDFNSSSHVTNYTYESGSSSCNGSFPTSITSPVSSLAAVYAYNCTGGVVTSVTDANAEATDYQYTDPNFWRLTETQYADGGQTTISYTDVANGFTVETCRLVSSSLGNHCLTQSLDGLGRVVRSVDGQTSAEVDAAYDSLGRVYSVSNPHTDTPEPTDGTTYYSYDALSRPADVGTAHAIKFPDGAYTSVTYSANCVTGVDPAQHKRTLCSDGLGRLTSVAEDPSNLNYQTSYSYDTLNDLTGVAQGSSQTRTYTYDMLARLASAKIPEVNSGGTQCSTTYGYDANGNLTSRTAPLENQTSCSSTVTTTYGYDAVNRLTSKSYSDTTPTVNFYYDQLYVTIGSWTSPMLLKPLGRLTEATTTVSGSAKTGVVYSYDPVGRISGFWQCNPSNCGSSAYVMTYTYDKAGDVSSWLHPDTSLQSAGITLTNTINSAQQVTSVQSSWQDTNHPQYMAENVTYTPWGAVSQLENGCVGSGCANTFETYTYDNRLQPWMIELGTAASGNNAYSDYCLVYNYFSSWTAPSSCPSPSAVPTSGSGNNGNVMGYWYQDSVQSGFSHTASYGYDGVNRLNAACTLSGTQCATSGSNVYSLAFAYDQFGNMWCTGAVGGGSAIGYCPAWSYNSGTNQLSSSTGCTYDAAGDLTKDCSTSSNHTYQWDAEGRVASVDNGSTWSFTYNALGQRVQWGYSGGTNEQLFDPSGTWLGQVGGYDLVPRGAGYLVLYFGSETDFNHINNLSSTTVRTNHAGTAVEDMLFYPWGQVWRSWGSGGYNFAQLPYYDTTTNTSITQFRLQSPGLGRWLSPDPAPPDITNPQSLNRYPYVLNNPTTLTDRLGLWPTGSQPICEASPVRPHGVHAMYSGGSGCFVGGWGEGGMLGDQPTMGEPGLPDMGFDMYGNDIFDALSGEPGTYLYFGTNGSLGFGFSIPLWQETENYIDATMQANPGLAELVPPSGYVVVEQQLGADVVATGLIPDIEALAQEQLQLADMMDAGAYYLNRLTKLGFGPENPIGENFAFWQTMLNIENSWQGLGYSQDPTLQYGAYLNAYSTQYQNFLVYQANFLNFMPKGW